ncbi:MFS transporter [Actinomadura darangshiensis]|uniref:MFS transporter n=1 Tax=Actinomadura darangshiensis TaxID=705336 RepID=A0A4V2YPX4_9ACTN|nr:MFS transporter [Actinomadura darangshiensis]TDD59927.1 MFS transporter [Actinomadura darangshiensis]
MAGPAERTPLWRLTPAQRLLEGGELLNSLAFFAAMPFAPLYLTGHTGLGKPGVGAVVGAVALTAAFGGLLGGMIVDRIGAVPLMRAGLVAYVAVYGLLAAVRAAAPIVVLFLLLGVARTMVEPGAKKLLSHAADDEGRMFRVRYMTLCVGGIGGPAIGGALYHVSPVAFFAVPAFFYACYLVVVLIRNRALMALQPPRGHGPPPSSRESVLGTLRDRRLLAVVTGGIVVFFVFSQLESMIPLYMKGQYGDRTEGYFAALFITNAVLALAFQLPIDKVSGRLGRTTMIVAGAANFTIAYACFWASTAGLAWLFAGIVFWTIGEGILLPMPDMAVHEMASDERKGAYFGLSEVRQLGFFLGPFAGGFLLDAGSTPFFLVMGTFIFLCVPLLRTPRNHRGTLALPSSPTETTPPARLG